VSSRTRSSEKRTDDGGDREASRGGGDANATATGRGATAITYKASRQLSTSSTTVNINFRFDKLLISFIFQQLVDKMLPIRNENAHQTLFSNSKFYKKRQSHSTLAHDMNASTSREEVTVVIGCKPMFLYMSLIYRNLVDLWK